MNTMTRPLCIAWIASAALISVLIEPSRGDVVGLWRFNEASGNATDSSGNGNTGTFVGPNATRSAGKPGFGNAAQFSKVTSFTDFANSSYLDVPADYSLQVGLHAGDPWTFAAWTDEFSDGFGFLDSNYGTILHYKRTLSDTVPYPTPDYGLTFQSGAPGDEQYYLWKGRPDDASNPFRIGTGVSAETNVDKWTHVAFVYNGSDVIFYVNGAEADRTTVGAQDAIYPGYTGAVQIGATPGFGADRNYNGKLDDVAVFNQALTPAQLATIMTGDFSAFIHPLSPPTTAEWQPSTFGTWSLKTDWFPSVSPNSGLITAVFGNATTAPTTVVNDQAVTVHGLQFNHTQAYVLAGTGSITLSSGGAGNSAISVMNAGGAVTHEIQLPVQLSSNTDVSIAAGTVLEFDSRLELNGHSLNLSGAGRLNINNDAGTSTTGSLVNTGVLGGSGKITGGLVNTGSGTLAVEILGNGALGAQGLTVVGNAALDGTLLIDVATGFTPSSGSTFTILTAGSITDNGLILTGDATGFTYAVVGGTNLVLTFGGSLAGDYNHNGVVDAADYVVWRNTDGTPAGYSLWRSNFGRTAGAGSSAAVGVPEPPAWTIFIWWVCFIAIGCRWPLLRSSMYRLQSGRPITCRACALVTIAVSSFVFPGATRATILTFSGQYGGNASTPGTYAPFQNGYQIIDEYGDRVTSLTQSNIASNDFGGTDWYNLYYGESGEGFTPNVVVDYPSSSTGIAPPGVYRYWNPYGSFTDAAYPSDGTTTPAEFYMTFTADAGVSVKLNSLQLSRDAGASPESVTVRVHQGNNPASLGAQLYSSGPTTVSAMTPVTISPNVSASSVTVVYSFAGNGVDNNWEWAIDNIKFSQIGGGVATTASWAVNGSGLWNKPSNWSPDTSPNLITNGNDRTAVLGNVTTTSSTVVLSENITLKKLQFSHTLPYSVAGTSDLILESNSGNATLEVLNVGASVTHQISAKVDLHSNTTASIAAGTTLELNNRLDLGNFNLSKTGSGTLRINNLVTTSGGAISASGGMVAGSGTILGDFDNSGAIVAPGNSPGILTIGGNYHQTSAGRLQMELSGLQRGTEYDVLAVGGDAVIDGGTLEIVLRDGFRPHVGDVFDLLDFRSLAGGFTGFKFPSEWQWDTSRLGTDGTLTVVGEVPEPSTALFSLLLVTVVCSTGASRLRLPTRAISEATNAGQAT